MHPANPDEPAEVLVANESNWHLHLTEQYWDLTPPSTLANVVQSWATSEPIQSVLSEDSTFEISNENLPVRLFFGRFVRLQLAKAKTPHFFCWPGTSLSPSIAWNISSQDALSLFDEHSALFLGGDDGDVYPRMLPNRSEANVQDTFNRFYAWVGVYELTREWLIAHGSFEFDFLWLTSKFSTEQMKAWANSGMVHSYGVSVDDFRILSETKP